MTKGPGRTQKLGVVWAPEALRQIERIREGRDKTKVQKYLQKILVLVEDARVHPFEGLGKPEPLKFRVPPCWSRRINLEDRLIYRVTGGDLQIVSVLGHYTE